MIHITTFSNGIWFVKKNVLIAKVTYLWEEMRENVSKWEKYNSETPGRFKGLNWDRIESHSYLDPIASIQLLKMEKKQSGKSWTTKYQKPFLDTRVVLLAGGQKSDGMRELQFQVKVFSFPPIGGRSLLVEVAPSFTFISPTFDIHSGFCFSDYNDSNFCWGLWWWGRCLCEVWLGVGDVHFS